MDRVLNTVVFLVPGVYSGLDRRSLKEELSEREPHLLSSLVNLLPLPHFRFSIALAMPSTPLLSPWSGRARPRLTRSLPATGRVGACRPWMAVSGITVGDKCLYVLLPV